ncbi:MAG: hypothetical protein AAB482_04115 [Patescibacteria group bacterium]
MRKYLFIAFLGFWVALVPFLPISCGSTQTAILFVSGLVIMIISVWSLRESLSS